MTDLQKIIEISCKEPTLAKALSVVAVWETERVIQQAKQFYETGLRSPNGSGWDTCFRYSFEQLLKKWYETNKEDIRINY